jgi:tryptophan-rich sensory protein
MGIAAWLICRRYGPRASGVALWLFLIQLALNALWAWLLFQWRNGTLSFAEIVLFWFFVFATLVSFWRLLHIAGALLIPYLAWVSFVTVLTFTIWKRNPNLLA